MTYIRGDAKMGDIKILVGLPQLFPFTFHCHSLDGFNKKGRHMNAKAMRKF